MNYVQMWLFMTNQSEPLRQTSLLMLLAGGIGHGDTLLQSLKSHETESHGHWASKIGQLRLLMEQGHTLSSSLAIVRDLLPDQTISVIRTGEMSGALPDVLIDEAKRISGSIPASRASGITPESLFLMTALLGTIIVGIVSFLMLFIVPKLQSIFVGFGTELPGTTVSVIQIFDFLGNFWFLFVIPVSALVFAFSWWTCTSAGQRLRLGYHRLMEHWPRYWLPGLLRQLSLSAATGQPLGTALDFAMTDMPPGRASRTVSELRHRVTGGEDTIAAMVEVGLLGRKEAAFLQSSLRTRHLDWGLRHLAQSIEQKRDRMARRIPELLGPLVILILGVVVLFVCLAFFMPLVKLINDLS